MLFLRTFFCRTAAVLALAAPAACSSSKKADPAPTPRGLGWTVDGSAVATTTVQSQKNSGGLSVAGTLNPGGPVSTYVMLAMPQAVGTYTFGPTSAASAAYSSSTGGVPTVYYAGGNSGAGTVTGAGTIVVTALTATNVTGTFTFTGINANTGKTKNVSQGRFNVGL